MARRTAGDCRREERPAFIESRLDRDPGLHLGEIDGDAALAEPGTYVNRRSERLLTESSPQLRLRLMTDRTLVGGRRRVVTLQLAHEKAPIL